MLGKLKAYEPIPAPAGDCRLELDHGRWSLCVVVEADVCPDTQGNRMVSIDPGVRSFVTFYSPFGVGKIGEHDFSRIQRLCHHMDDLISRRAKEPNRRRRYRMGKALDRMRLKIHDLIDELHHKTALFFVTNFDIILIPKFETSKMVLRGKRKIRAKTVRSMLTFSHYKFQQFLRFKAREHGKIVIAVDEAYTSKTCSWNGKIKEIGGAKWIKDGDIVVDRDYNGARGIYLRALVDTPLPGNDCSQACNS
jgi:putative transposase